MSNGRFMLGVGIGWLQEEFVAMGTPFERRGARFDDYVVAMKKVWSGEVVEHDSEFLELAWLQELSAAGAAAARAGDHRRRERQDLRADRDRW